MLKLEKTLKIFKKKIFENKKYRETIHYIQIPVENVIFGCEEKGKSR